ncbi:MAG: hypothetical protein KQJ78_14800 [Deltaproteobacteria bacterium]|nr:hypothetical protein [Deltaproteobacteria bacterium]
MADKVARKATLSLTYRGQDLGRHCVGFTYTDNDQDALDGIEVTLEDREGYWLGPWWPRKMDTIVAAIHTEDWEFPGQRQTLACGVFEIEEPAVAGPPDQVTIQGHSAKVSQNNRTQRKSTAWDNPSLQMLAAEIAGRMGLGLIWEGNDVSYKRQEQKSEGDLAFLRRLCREAGNGVKVVNESLVVFAGQTWDARPPSFTLKRSQALGENPLITNYRFQNQSHDKFQSCIVRWTDPQTKEVYQGRFDEPKADKASGETFMVRDRRVDSNADAQKMAQSLLRAKNQGDFTAEMQLMGDIRLKAGLTCQVAEFGRFSGKYLVEEARHRLDAFGGYTAQLTLRKVLEY